MKKQYGLYALFFVLTFILINLVGLVVSSARAGCDCEFNTVQDNFLFFGSLAASGLVVYLIHKKRAVGETYLKSFAKSIWWILLVMAVLIYAVKMYAITYLTTFS